MDFYGNIEQYKKIERLLIKLHEEQINLNNISYNFLRKYLEPEDITIFCKMLNIRVKIDVKLKNKIIYTTPYTILGIDEGEYSKEELLNILTKKINLVRNQVSSEKEKQQSIDEILDAYNDIIIPRQLKK